MILIVTSTSTTSITLQDNDGLSGSQLELGASTRVISAKKILTLMYQATLKKWQTIARETAWKDFGDKNESCAALLKAAQKLL